jgi:hypothetical protein
MYLYPKAGTNIVVLVSYLSAWVFIGAAVNALIAYGVVDISISTFVAGGVLGLLSAVFIDLLGIIDYTFGESSNTSGLIENAFHRPPANTPQIEQLVSTRADQTDRVLPSPAEVEPARETERDAASRQAFYEELPHFLDLVIRKTKQHYSKDRFNRDEGPVVDIFVPKAIYQRYDLFCREVVPWLVERGWQWDKEERITYFRLSLRAQLPRTPAKQHPFSSTEKSF